MFHAQEDHLCVKVLGETAGDEVVADGGNHTDIWVSGTSTSVLRGYVKKRNMYNIYSR